MYKQNHLEQLSSSSMVLCPGGQIKVSYKTGQPVACPMSAALSLAGTLFCGEKCRSMGALGSCWVLVSRISSIVDT